jgi:plasmid stability protein
MATLNIKNMPDSLYRKLKARAKRQNRSLSQEVTHILSAAVEEPEKLDIMQLRGLGKELWRGIDAAKYVEEERNSWE